MYGERAALPRRRLTRVAVRACVCDCHRSLAVPYPVVTFDAREDGDVIEAAVACSQCRGLHARIFLKPPKPSPVPLPSTYSTDETPEG
jgi:hypothetical protein